MDSIFAAIDIGSNSTNLLIADSSGKTLERIVRSTRLGAGLTKTGSLSDEAIERTVSCINEYAALINHHKVTHKRIVATQACRIANNSETFFKKVRASSGLEPEIISGEQEGSLAYRGATISFGRSTSKRTLVIDIGGASTELMIGAESLRTAVSIPFGAVTLSESELHRDPPRPEELTNAISLVSDAVDDAVHMNPELARADQIIGVAGTIVTIAAVELGLKQFDPEKLHAMRLTREAAEDVFRTLATEPLADRVFNPGLPRDRADIIVGGCCLLVAVMRRLQIPELIVSQHNLLDGVVDELRNRSA